MDTTILEYATPDTLAALRRDLDYTQRNGINDSTIDRQIQAIKDEQRRRTIDNARLSFISLITHSTTIPGTRAEGIWETVMLLLQDTNLIPSLTLLRD